jgi:ribosome-associated toxin RatA of RatAB toxin-antitoxin module
MNARWITVGGLLSLAVLVAGCGDGAVDWAAPENLILREKSVEKNGKAELEYWSLVDAPCQAIYDALVDVEHYPEFIPGVDTTQIIARTDNSKTVLIAQRVVARQSNAKVQWTFDPARRNIQFKTLTSDFSFNDGRYSFEESPDKKRCLVKTVYEIRPAEGGQPTPLSSLRQSMRDSHLAASAGVKKRVTGAK